MPTAYFTTQTTLPATDCTQEDIYQLCRTLKPVSGALVDGNTLKTNATTGAIEPGNFTPCWQKFTKTFSNFSQAALTFDLEIFSMPAGGVIHAVKMKHSTTFQGGAIATYTLSVGTSVDLDKYMYATDVKAAVSATNYTLIWAPAYPWNWPNLVAAPAAYSQAYTDTLRNGINIVWSTPIESHTAPTSIRLAAVTTGANLNAATQGSVDVWILTSTPV